MLFEISETSSNGFILLCSKKARKTDGSWFLSLRMLIYVRGCKRVVNEETSNPVEAQAW